MKAFKKYFDYVSAEHYIPVYAVATASNTTIVITERDIQDFTEIESEIKIIHHISFFMITKMNRDKNVVSIEIDEKKLKKGYFGESNNENEESIYEFETNDARNFILYLNRALFRILTAEELRSIHVNENQVFIASIPALYPTATNGTMINNSENSIQPFYIYSRFIEKVRLTLSDNSESIESIVSEVSLKNLRKILKYRISKVDIFRDFPDCSKYFQILLNDIIPLSQNVTNIIFDGSNTIANTNGIENYVQTLIKLVENSQNIKEITFVGELPPNIENFFEKLGEKKEISLLTLNFKNSKLSEQQLSNLITSHIFSLNFVNTKFDSNDQFFNFIENKNLEFLGVKNSPQTDFLSNFNKFINITILSLCKNNIEIGDVLNFLSKNETQIQYLYLSGNKCEKQISNDIKIHRLKEIRLDHISWGNNFLSYFQLLIKTQIFIDLSHSTMDENEWDNAFNYLNTTTDGIYHLSKLLWNGNKVNKFFFSYLRKCVNSIDSLQIVDVINQSTEKEIFDEFISFLREAKKLINLFIGFSENQESKSLTGNQLKSILSSLLFSMKKAKSKQFYLYVPNSLSGDEGADALISLFSNSKNCKIKFITFDGLLPKSAKKYGELCASITKYLTKLGKKDSNSCEIQYPKKDLKYLKNSMQEKEYKKLCEDFRFTLISHKPNFLACDYLFDRMILSPCLKKKKYIEKKNADISIFDLSSFPNESTDFLLTEGSESTNKENIRYGNYDDDLPLDSFLVNSGSDRIEENNENSSENENENINDDEKDNKSDTSNDDDDDDDDDKSSSKSSNENDDDDDKSSSKRSNKNKNDDDDVDYDELLDASITNSDSSKKASKSKSSSQNNKSGDDEDSIKSLNEDENINTDEKDKNKSNANNDDDDENEENKNRSKSAKIDNQKEDKTKNKRKIKNDDNNDDELLDTSLSSSDSKQKASNSNNDNDNNEISDEKDNDKSDNKSSTNKDDDFIKNKSISKSNEIKNANSNENNKVENEKDESITSMNENINTNDKNQNKDDDILIEKNSITKSNENKNKRKSNKVDNQNEDKNSSTRSNDNELLDTFQSNSDSNKKASHNKSNKENNDAEFTTDMTQDKIEHIKTDESNNDNKSDTNENKTKNANKSKSNKIENENEDKISSKRRNKNKDDDELLDASLSSSDSSKKASNNKNNSQNNKNENEKITANMNKDENTNADENDNDNKSDTIKYNSINENKSKEREENKTENANKRKNNKNDNQKEDSKRANKNANDEYDIKVKERAILNKEKEKDEDEKYGKSTADNEQKASTNNIKNEQESKHSISKSPKSEHSKTNAKDTKTKSNSTIQEPWFEIKFDEEEEEEEDQISKQKSSPIKHSSNSPKRHSYNSRNIKSEANRRSKQQQLDEDEEQMNKKGNSPSNHTKSPLSHLSPNSRSKRIGINRRSKQHKQPDEDEEQNNKQGTIDINNSKGSPNQIGKNQQNKQQEEDGMQEQINKQGTNSINHSKNSPRHSRNSPRHSNNSPRRYSLISHNKKIDYDELSKQQNEDDDQINKQGSSQVSQSKSPHRHLSPSPRSSKKSGINKRYKKHKHQNEDEDDKQETNKKQVGSQTENLRNSPNLYLSNSRFISKIDDNQNSKPQKKQINDDDDDENQLPKPIPIKNRNINNNDDDDDDDDYENDKNAKSSPNKNLTSNRNHGQNRTSNRSLSPTQKRDDGSPHSARSKIKSMQIERPKLTSLHLSTITSHTFESDDKYKSKSQRSKSKDNDYYDYDESNSDDLLTNKLTPNRKKRKIVPQTERIERTRKISLFNEMVPKTTRRSKKVIRHRKRHQIQVDTELVINDQNFNDPVKSRRSLTPPKGKNILLEVIEDRGSDIEFPEMDEITVKHQKKIWTEIDEKFSFNNIIRDIRANK